MVHKSMTKEARIYNGEKTVSSISGAGKNEQRHLQEKKTTDQYLTQTLMKKFSLKYYQIESNNVYKESCTTTKWNLFQICRAGSTFKNELM